MKKILCVLIAFVLMLCVLCVPASATVYKDSLTISLSKKEVTVGSTVTVTLTYNAKYQMTVVTGQLRYNRSVLQLASQSENYNDTGSVINIAEDFNRSNSRSIQLKFKAIAAGEGSLSCSMQGFSGGTGADDNEGSASAGSAVTVVEEKPSSNTNLSSIKLSEGTLEPEFRQGTTNYTVSLKYTVEKITISANAVAGDSVVDGLGTFDLSVGENKYGITVKAASGDKKTYMITVKRMTEEETREAEIAERENDPLLFVVNGVDRYLTADISAMSVPQGYRLSSMERKGTEIGALEDIAGKYKLFWATDSNDADGAFYTLNDDGEFTRVSAILTGGMIYIIEPFEEGLSVNEMFVPGKYEAEGGPIDCYKYADGEFSDFYIFYCYVNGENGYYIFDAAQNTMQREPLLLYSPPAKEEVKEETEEKSLLERFTALDTSSKTVILLLAFAALMIVVLIILLIAKALRSGGKAESGNMYGERIEAPDLPYEYVDISESTAANAQAQPGIWIDPQNGNGDGFYP